jgi:hypothetical protein
MRSCGVIYLRIVEITQQAEQLCRKRAPLRRIGETGLDLRPKAGDRRCNCRGGHNR